MFNLPLDSGNHEPGTQDVSEELLCHNQRKKWSHCGKSIHKTFTFAFFHCIRSHLFPLVQETLKCPSCEWMGQEELKDLRSNTHLTPIVWLSTRGLQLKIPFCIFCTFCTFISSLVLLVHSRYSDKWIQSHTNYNDQLFIYRISLILYGFLLKPYVSSDPNQVPAPSHHWGRVDSGVFCYLGHGRIITMPPEGTLPWIEVLHMSFLFHVTYLFSPHVHSLWSLAICHIHSSRSSVIRSQYPWLVFSVWSLPWASFFWVSVLVLVLVCCGFPYRKGSVYYIHTLHKDPN